MSAVLTGRHATAGLEPRQVRKEAAIRDAGCVVGRSRSGRRLTVEPRVSTVGAQPTPPFALSAQALTAPNVGIRKNPMPTFVSVDPKTSVSTDFLWIKTSISAS